MIQTAASRLGVVAFVGLCLISASTESARSSDVPKEKQVLSRAQALFGAPVSWDAHVFTIGGSFGARLWFDDSKRLFRIDVSPMGYFADKIAEHGESEPSLAESDCDRFIAKLSDLMPIGIREWDGLGYSGASAIDWTRKYDQAYIRLTERNSGYVGFEVLYVLDWTGKVEWKHESPRNSNYRFGVIGVGNERFLVSQEESGHLQVGKQNTFLGARDTLLSYDKHGHHKPM